MLDAVPKIDLTDVSEALPAFVTMITMVLTYNIAEGMALGMICYTFVKLLSGQWRQISLTLAIVTVLLLLRYIFQ